MGLIPSPTTPNTNGAPHFISVSTRISAVVASAAGCHSVDANRALARAGSSAVVPAPGAANEGAAAATDAAPVSASAAQLDIPERTRNSRRGNFLGWPPFARGSLLTAR